MSISYNPLSDNARAILAKDEPAAKAALCVLANREFGLSEERIAELKNNEFSRWGGITRYEGGICVNEKEVCVTPFNAYLYMGAGWRDGTEKPEEHAVAQALGKLEKLALEKGIDEIRKEFGQNHRRDPLRSLLRL